MKKVLLIGSPGSGKSTFGRALAQKTGLPLYHLDLIYHKPDRTTIPREEFDAALEDLLAREAWIIDGNYSRTMPRRLDACDTVFFFDLPVKVCLDSVRGRIGQVRPDMPWVEREIDPEFMQFIESFPQERTPHIRELLVAHPDLFVVTFTSRKQANQYLNTL